MIQCLSFRYLNGPLKPYNKDNAFLCWLSCPLILDISWPWPKCHERTICNAVPDKPTIMGWLRPFIFANIGDGLLLNTIHLLFLPLLSMMFYLYIYICLPVSIHAYAMITNYGCYYMVYQLLLCAPFIFHACAAATNYVHYYYGFAIIIMFAIQLSRLCYCYCQYYPWFAIRIRCVVPLILWLLRRKKKVMFRWEVDATGSSSGTA